MSKRKANTELEFFCPGDCSGKFFMLPPELVQSPQFCELSCAAQVFYLRLCAHKQTEIQRQCLYAALTEYNKLLDLELSDFDIQNEATPNKHTKYTSHYFVAPVKQMELYGYKANYVTKLKKELIDKGFIEVVFGGKGRFNGWNENVTIYKFSGKWKQNALHH